MPDNADGESQLCGAICPIQPMEKGDKEELGVQWEAGRSKFDLEKRTGLYKVFWKESVLKSRFVPSNFPGNLLQDPEAENWTWCDGYVGPCDISGM